MSSTPINVGIFDDHSLFREFLKSYLSQQVNINVAVVASDVGDLMNKLRVDFVDILILDIFLPRLHDIEAIEAIRGKYPAIKILVLSMSTDMNLVSNMLDAGIHGYVCKSDEPQQMLDAIHSIVHNRMFRNKWLTEGLYWSRQLVLEGNKAKYSLLSDREKRVLQLLWEEKNNKEIADELFLGLRSVEKIRQDIKEKIGAKTIVGILKYGIHKKIIEIADTRVGLAR